MSGFSRFKNPAPAAPATPAPAAATPPPAPAPTPAPAPAPAPEPAPAVVEPAEVKSAVPAIPEGRGLAVVGLKANVLAQVVADAEASTVFAEPFPHVLIKGGNAGGTLVPSKSTEKAYAEIAGQLPQGKQPAQGVLMGIRAEAIAWPRDMEESDGDRPCISCAIPFTDSDGIALLTTGCENFQFAPKEVKKQKWDLPVGGPGRLRPIFQVLLWLPKIGPIVLQAAPLLETFRSMAKQLNALVNKETGELDPIPVTATVVTETWYEDNVYHYWKIQPWVQPAAAAVFNDYRAWVQDVVANRPDQVQAVTDWTTGDDKPASDQDVARLRQAANMTNPRRRRGGNE